MDIILRETERLNQLITDYLLFAKPARELKDSIDLGSLISETIEVFRHSPDTSNIRIDCRVDGSFRVLGDARQLGQVFWNLFVNAAHAMPGGGALTVSASYVTAEPLKGVVCGEYVEVKVADTGRGIAPEDLKRIFDPFFSTKDEGTGLGLAIVHRIIESHNGRLEVKSVPGTGTSFRILLPVEGVAEALKA
jgi:two-component system sensor histidine kinase PilS (NtrC family)